jgi:hypothetical protein
LQAWAKRSGRETVGPAAWCLRQSSFGHLHVNEAACQRSGEQVFSLIYETAMRELLGRGSAVFGVDDVVGNGADEIIQCGSDSGFDVERKQV